MQRSGIVAAILAILAVSGIGYSAWRYVSSRDKGSCRACNRPIHAHSKTVALVDGKRIAYCCPACALWEQKQPLKPVKVIELTDFAGGDALKPENSYVVRNSNVNPCLQHQHPAVNENSQPLESTFDRCSPSVLSFRDERTALEFASQHGGQVMKFSDFASAFK